MLELQIGDAVKQPEQAREEAQDKDVPFDVELYRQALSHRRDLGEPSIDAIVIGPFGLGGIAMA